MKSYEDICKQISKRPKVDGNATVFDYGYTPKKIFEREEGEDIISTIINFDKYSVNQNMFYFGARGCGKTITFKYIKKFLENLKTIETPMLYINCREKNTILKVLSYIVGENLNGKAICDGMELVSEKFEKLILVLDEIDLFNYSQRSRDMLYLFSRCDSTKFQMFLLSNNVNFMNLVDEATKSTLQIRSKHFRNYNAEEIREILRLRETEAGIKVKEPFIPQLAAMTANMANSDIRVALKTLQLAYLNNKYDDLEGLFEEARRESFNEILINLPNQMIISLISIILTKDKIVPRIYKEYQRIANRNREKSLTYQAFYNNLNYLQSIGIIMLYKRQVHRGWSKEVELLCYDELIKGIFRNRGMY